MVHVIVVGAGLAGAAASLKLGKAGHRVTVLEGAGRIGGRAVTRPFHGDPPGAEALEFGGSWITPWHHRIQNLVQEHGLALRERQPVTQRLYHRDGADRGNGPVGEAERLAHERVLARVAADAILYKKGASEDEQQRPLTGITYRNYLDRIKPPAGTRHLLNAWWTVSGSGAHDVIAASEFLSSCSYGGGLAESMIDCWSHTVTPGMTVLAQRMLEASRATVRLNVSVNAVHDSADEARLTTSAGETIIADHIVLALGINQMKGLSFDPPLPEPRRSVIARGHGGRAFKIWIKARGVPVGSVVTGNSAGIELLFAERSAKDGTVLLIGFGLDQDGAAPGDTAWVKTELAKLAPNAQFIASDWHDWLNDPFARGTWVSAPADMVDGFDARHWQPLGRVALASSDYAAEQAGWFEGSIRSGEDAAESVIQRLKMPGPRKT